MIWILFGALMVLSMIASRSVQTKFERYSRISTDNGMTGREVAEQMLRDFDIHDVTVGKVQGTLTDHYNPTNKMLNLSPEVYQGRSIAAAAIAAHECGHAIQHATAYRWLLLRSKLVPAVNFSNRYVSWILLAGVLLVQRFPQLLLFGIALFAITTLFSLVTLPVEIDASRRALKWIASNNMTTRDTYPYAKSALRSAAYTYVMAAVTSLATLLYYVMIYLNGRDR